MQIVPECKLNMLNLFMEGIGSEKLVSQAG